MAMFLFIPVLHDLIDHAAFRKRRYGVQIRDRLIIVGDESRAGHRRRGVHPQ
jgi:hypothetical protein